MKIIEQSVRLISMTPEPLKALEYAGRTCYASRHKITEGSAGPFVQRAMRRKPPHMSILEFADAFFEFTTSRGIADELRTHRLTSPLMQSTRYVDKRAEVEFVRPVWMGEASLGFWEFGPDGFLEKDGTPYPLPTDEQSERENYWKFAMLNAEKSYKSLRNSGLPPEHARGVLPLDSATVIVMKTNFRTWGHIVHLRCDKAAHPAMRELMGMAKDILAKEVPEVFGEVM